MDPNQRSDGADLRRPFWEKGDSGDAGKVMGHYMNGPNQACCRDEARDPFFGLDRTQPCNDAGPGSRYHSRLGGKVLAPVTSEGMSHQVNAKLSL